jgi:hypothetical protein
MHGRGTFHLQLLYRNRFNKIVIFFIDLNGNNKDTYCFDDLKRHMMRTTEGGGVVGAAGGLAQTVVLKQRLFLDGYLSKWYVVVLDNKLAVVAGTWWKTDMVRVQLLIRTVGAGHHKAVM